MSDKNRVTREIVIAVKRKLADPKYSVLTLDDIGMLCGTSGTTVGRIRSGKYDYMLEDGSLNTIALDENLYARLDAVLAELREIKGVLVNLSTINENEATDD